MIVHTSDGNAGLNEALPMSEIPREESPSRFAMCDTYNLEGWWTCEGGALKVSSNKQCWKCYRPRNANTVWDDALGLGNGRS